MRLDTRGVAVVIAALKNAVQYQAKAEGEPMVVKDDNTILMNCVYALMQGDSLIPPEGLGGSLPGERGGEEVPPKLETEEQYEEWIKGGPDDDEDRPGPLGL